MYLVVCRCIEYIHIKDSLRTRDIRHNNNNNKSSLAGLVVVALKKAQYLLPSQGIIGAEAQLLNQIIDTNLTKSILTANNQRGFILYIFSISLIVVCLLIWFQVLLRLNEGDNDFKKVLQVLPPNLILSSSMLKLFLKQTSQDIKYL